MAGGGDRNIWIASAVGAIIIHAGAFYAYASQTKDVEVNRVETEISIISLPSFSGDASLNTQTARASEQQAVAKPVVEVRQIEAVSDATSSADLAQNVQDIEANRASSSAGSGAQEITAIDSLRTTPPAQSPSQSSAEDIQAIDALRPGDIRNATANKVLPVAPSQSVQDAEAGKISTAAETETSRIATIVDQSSGSPVVKRPRNIEAVKTARISKAIEAANALLPQTPVTTKNVSKAPTALPNNQPVKPTSGFVVSMPSRSDASLASRVENTIVASAPSNKTVAENMPVPTRIENTTTEVSRSKSTVELNRAVAINLKPPVTVARSAPASQPDVAQPAPDKTSVVVAAEKSISTKISKTGAIQLKRSAVVGRATNEQRSSVNLAPALPRYSRVLRPSLSVSPASRSKVTVVSQNTGKVALRVTRVQSIKPPPPTPPPLKNPAKTVPGPKIALLARPKDAKETGTSGPADDGAAIGKVINFLKFYEAKNSCFLALAEIRGKRNIGLSGFSNEVSSWQSFRENMASNINVKVAGELTSISDAQCLVMSFARQIREYPSFSLSMTLKQPIINSGGFVAGQLNNVMGRQFQLILIDDEGSAINIKRFTSLGNGQAEFSFQVNLTDGGVSTAQLLIAIASDQPLRSAEFQKPVSANELLANIQLEAVVRDLKLDLAIAGFVVQ